MASLPDNYRDQLSSRWRHFALFSGPEWHRVLNLRTAIFVVEQECPYQEVDQKDTEQLASGTFIRQCAHRERFGCYHRGSRMRSVRLGVWQCMRIFGDAVSLANS